MTREQYKSELGVIESKIKTLYNRKNEIREAFLRDNAKYKVGDKVVLIWNELTAFNKVHPERRMEAYVGSVHDKYFTGIVNYEFKKVKKDGTMSGQSAGIYMSSPNRIELLTTMPANKNLLP
jgi:ribosomal protein L21E